MSSKRLSLAEQIAELERAAPVDFDPEDVLISGINPEELKADKDIEAAREHYVEVGSSTLRKHDITDPKYDGIRTTRKALLDEAVASEGPSEGEEFNQSENEEEDENEDDEIPSQGDDEGEAESQGERGEEGSSDEGNHVSLRPISKRKSLADEPAPAQDMSGALRQKREEDRQKGKAVSRQISIWDALLESRIRLQKAVNAANRLPTPSLMEGYVHHPQCREALNKMLKEVELFTNELFDLQQYLLTKNENIPVPQRKRRKIDYDSESGYDRLLENISEDAAASEHAMHSWVVQTLNKWSSKIQAVAPSVLLPSNRNAFLKGSQQVKSVVQLAEETLRAHDKLLERTRIRRGKDRRITEGERERQDVGGTDEDSELFDDTDFYQQLLRDVIDSKGNSGGADDWMAIQREKKAKKKVDTRASKGRKIRYQVHEKLQNFMVPVPVFGAWHEAQIDELFASLLGKGYGKAGGEEDETLPIANANRTVDELESQLDHALLSGFRVFG